MFYESFYVLEINSNGEKKYFYNKRFLVNFPDSARQFSTLANARKTARLSGFSDFSVLKCINGSYLYC